MAKKNKARFKRSLAKRSYRKIFYIFTEGENTELIYFGMLKRICSKVHIELISANKKTSAKQILQQAKEFIANRSLSNNEFIWIVIDTDKNSKHELKKLLVWSKSKNNYGVALSNPMFEYWLLLHFEDGNNIKSIETLNKRLKNHLPKYSKQHLDTKKFQSEINTAISNAKRKFAQCKDWYIDNHTTVFQLVEKILMSEE